MAKLVIIILALIVLAGGVNADIVNDPWSPQYFSYLFYLYYDNGQLFADRDLEFKYDLVAEEFVPEQLTTQFPFSGEVINLKGEVAAVFKFDPRRSNPNFSKGKISVKAPYFPDGQKIIFYDAQNNPLITVFVSESSFCDDDGICNSDRGEDTRTCPNDCRSTTPSPIIPDGTTGVQGGMMKIIIYGLIVVGALIGGWFGWKWRKRRKESNSTLIMPTTPLNK